jgi:hypothetical protein
VVDEKVLQKIRKSISLATNNPNTPEAQSAWRKSCELLSKYDLTVDDLYNKRTKQSGFLPLPKERKEKVTLRQLLARILHVEHEKRIVLQLIPDQTVKSGREIESILNTFHSMHERMTDRFWYNGFKLVFKTQDFVSYRIVYEHGRISFYIVTPEKYQKTITNSISSVWPKVALVESDSDIQFDPEKTQCAYLELKDHFFKSTLVDRNQIAPMPSLMAAGRNLMDDDKALLDISFIPKGKRWQMQARDARNKSRMGMEVRKKPSSLIDVLYVIGDFIAESVIEKFLAFADMMIGSDDNKKGDDPFVRGRSEAIKFLPSTEQKAEYNGFDTVVRIASQSEQSQRANLTLRAIGTAFKDLSADNEFEIREARNSKSFLNRLETFKPPLLRINGNILSVPECSQLLQLPSSTLQEEYPEIERIDNMEVEADPRLLKGGFLLGEVTVKKKSVKVYQPLDDWNEFCRTMIVLGGQGQGKTKGFISNLLINAYQNGFGAMAIDAAKKEISEQMYYAVKKGIIPKEDFVHIDAGKIAMSLDWKEALLDAEDGQSRLASTAIDFFDIQKDTTGQTGRFLRAMIMSMKTGKMSELIDIMENEKEIRSAIERLPKGSLTQRTMKAYLEMSPPQRRQIAAPIYNRLDTIMGDNYLAKCLESDYEINMLDIMCQKKIFVFDFSDEDLLPAQQDVCINLLFSKIDLAMRMRKKIRGKEFERPFFIACDEPAKYLRSANIWEAMTVQGRKWRIGFAWAFHYWTQLPNKFQEAIKTSLPHYFLYPTSKDQWRGVAEEIQPFTLENAMKLKAFHAINVIYSTNGYFKPFIAKMTPPPMTRFRFEKR